jgi:ABC-type multidrug transport system fused ATPase/permease subunit
LRHVSVVRQSPALFTDTVANNIAYGAISYRKVTREEIIKSAKAANAHDFIRLGLELELGGRVRVRVRVTIRC